MTWPTDLARQSTNPFSPEALIRKNLMEESLRNDRDRNEELFTEPLREESDIPHSQNYIDIKNYLSNFKNNQRKDKAIASPGSEGRSLSSRQIKTVPNAKSPFSLRRILLSWCCMQ